jgi:hypothetical protein
MLERVLFVPIRCCRLNAIDSAMYGVVGQGATRCCLARRKGPLCASLAIFLIVFLARVSFPDIAFFAEPNIDEKRTDFLIFRPSPPLRLSRRESNEYLFATCIVVNKISGRRNKTL